MASGKCKDLANLSQKYSQALSGQGGSQDLKTTVQVVQEFADDAPSDIKSDFQVFADCFEEALRRHRELQARPAPDAATLAKLRLGTSIDTQKLTLAAQHIEAWVTKNCHA